MLLRVLPLLIALALWLAPSSQAAVFVAAPPASASPSTSENACTAFLPNESESQIGLLCANDPLDKTDPMGLTPLATPAPTPRMVRDITRSVIGSNIPQRIRYSESGNWNDRKIANHYSNDLEATTKKGGRTIGLGTINESGKNVHIDLRVDWLVDRKYKNTDVVTRELDHVQAFRDLSRGIDNTLQSNTLSMSFLRGFPDVVARSVHDQKMQFENPFWGDRPHDIITHPPIPVMLSEYEATH